MQPVMARNIGNWQNNNQVPEI